MEIRPHPYYIRAEKKRQRPRDLRTETLSDIIYAVGNFAEKEKTRLDKWNRDGQNLYTDMNAQRRHRRKPDQAPDVKRAAEAAEEPEIRYDPNIFRRPAVKNEKRE